MTTPHRAPRAARQMVSPEGGVYALVIAPHEPVQLNMTVACHLRERLRAAADARGMAMQDVLAELLGTLPLPPAA